MKCLLEERFEWNTCVSRFRFPRTKSGLCSRSGTAKSAQRYCSPNFRPVSPSRDLYPRKSFVSVRPKVIQLARRGGLQNQRPTSVMQNDAVIECEIPLLGGEVVEALPEFHLNSVSGGCNTGMSGSAAYEKGRVTH